MEYKIDEKNCRVRISGNKKELENFVFELCSIENYSGKNNLHLTNFEEYPINPSDKERIYYSNKGITYLPNVCSKQKEIVFNKIIKPKFRRALDSTQ